ncbi:ArnT family glycosyltransferase, partial [Simonsiella muelleri]|uniref:ArnT family glycosyltransferase n=1 Tax=Simonsiella muelleri TaxID=72 RepID=UPI003C701805
MIDWFAMLTYTPTPPRTDTAHREYPWALLLLVCVWLLPGVFSHDLWKPTEPQLYTAIQESVHGSWWLPTLYGQAYFDAPPFYVQAALAWQRWLSPTLTDAYTAARFASVMFTVIGLLGSGMAGYRFLGRHHGRSVVLILIGSFGMLPIGHFLDTKSMLFASVGLALWGYSVAHRQVVFSAVLVG